jgi:hypothetical protein
MLVTDVQDFLPSIFKLDGSLRCDTAKLRIWGSEVRISPGTPKIPINVESYSSSESLLCRIKYSAWPHASSL